jgi:hypothetical protein
LDRFPACLSYCLHLLNGFNAVEVNHGGQLTAMGSVGDWVLTSLLLKLTKIRAHVVRHARVITFQLAEVAVTGAMLRATLAANHRLRAPPLCA